MHRFLTYAGCLYLQNWAVPLTLWAPYHRSIKVLQPLIYQYKYAFIQVHYNCEELYTIGVRKDFQAVRKTQ